jgi:hypothetical protein
VTSPTSSAYGIEKQTEALQYHWRGSLEQAQNQNTRIFCTQMIKTDKNILS